MARQVFPLTETGQVTWVALARVAANKTLENVAANIFLPKETLFLIERKLAEPSQATLKRLSLYLQTPLYLMTSRPVSEAYAHDVIGKRDTTKHATNLRAASRIGAEPNMTTEHLSR